MDTSQQIFRYLNGELQGEELDRFKTYLNEHPEAVEELFTMADEEMLLSSAAGELQEHPGTVPGTKKPVSGVQRRKSSRKSTYKRALSRNAKSGRGVGWWIAVSIAACIAIIAGTHFYNIEQTEKTPDLIRATLMEVSGDITIRRDDQDMSGKVGMDILVGDSIRTGAGERCGITYRGEDTVISLTERTDITVQEKDGAKRVELKKGGLECNAAPQPPGKPLVFSTPQAQAEVLGTHFKLSIIKHGDKQVNASKLEVRDGSVRFISLTTDKSVDVSAGEYSIAGPGIPLEVKSVTGSPPVINIEPDSPVMPHRKVVFKSNVMDEGSPADRSRVSVFWSQESGPADITIANPSAFSTEIIFPLPGTYEVTLEASDNMFTVQDTHEVQVQQPKTLSITFQPKGFPVPEGYIVDTGALYNPQKGMGWDRDLIKADRVRYREDPDVGIEKRGHVSPGSAQKADTWEIVVENGRYSVTVCCGDSVIGQQGPHRVLAEGIEVIRDVMTDNQQPFVTKTEQVRVTDNRLTLTCGAEGTGLRDDDGTSDTNICYAIITRVE